MYIGQRVKQLREEQRLTLSELAEKSGVQIATLSRIENLKMVGSLESHMNIAKGLGVDITALYTHILEKPEPASDSQGKAKDAEIFAHNAKASQEFLTGRVLSKKMMPVLLKIEPRGKTNKEQNQPGSEKFIYILEGNVEVFLEDKKFALTKGNTLYFNSSTAHYFQNKGQTTAKIIAVSTPVTL